MVLQTVDNASFELFPPHPQIGFKTCFIAKSGKADFLRAHSYLYVDTAIRTAARYNYRVKYGI